MGTATLIDHGAPIQDQTSYSLSNVIVRWWAIPGVDGATILTTVNGLAVTSLNGQKFPWISQLLVVAGESPSMHVSSFCVSR